MLAGSTDDLLDSSTGRPPKGCIYCDKGSKMVLYITGLCRQDCFYCPLSEKKKDNDVIYANERPCQGDEWLEGVMEEAGRMRAQGTGITGGDPMVVVDRTIKVIRALKEKFGKSHHIHLYTTGPFDDGLLTLLSEAGLDEIRFHPPIATWKGFRHLGKDNLDGDPGDASIYENLINKAREETLSVGIEVPAVVDPKVQKNIFSEGLGCLLDYAAREDMEFVNINELEASHTNMEEFREMGYSLIGDSMAVDGSLELARGSIEKVLKDHPQTRTVFHICTSVYKDSIQLRNRLRRTAENVRRPFEIVTEDGTLLRGVVETDSPGTLLSRLKEDHDIPDEMMGAERNSLFIAPWILEDIGPELEERSYISEVYPTWDALEVERIPMD